MRNAIICNIPLLETIQKYSRVTPVIVAEGMMTYMDSKEKDVLGLHIATRIRRSQVRFIRELVILRETILHGVEICRQE